MLNFIKREKIYILMFLFILAVSVMNAGQVDKRHYEEERPLSAKSFEEIGITEAKVRDFFESERVTARFFRYAATLGFFIFISALALNLSFIFLRKKINFRTLPPRSPVAWGISDLIRAAVTIVFAAYLVGTIEGFILKFFNLNIGLNLRMMIGTFFIDIAVAMVILYFVMVKYGERLQALGIKSSLFFKDVLSGITAYIFILPFLVAVLFLSMWVLDLFGYSPPPQPVFDVFMEEKRSRVLFFLAIFVSLFGPLVEEMFFRGFVYGAIKKRFGVVRAIFLSACLFSLLHTNMLGFLPIMALGIVLAYLYERTGSLVASVTVHVIHNSIIIGFVFFIKELAG